MKHSNMKPPPLKNRAKPGLKVEETSPFDLWLNRGLHKIYDDVAQEPIPQDLLHLIEDGQDGENN